MNEDAGSLCPNEIKTCEELVINMLRVAQNEQIRLQEQTKELRAQTFRSVNGFMVRFGGPIETVEVSVASSWDIRNHLAREKAREMASTRKGIEEAAEMRFGYCSKGMEETHKEWPFTILVDSFVYAADVDKGGFPKIDLVQGDDTELGCDMLFPVRREAELREHALDCLREALLDYADRG